MASGAHVFMDWNVCEVVADAWEGRDGDKRTAGQLSLVKG